MIALTISIISLIGDVAFWMLIPTTQIIKIVKLFAGISFI